MVYVILRTTNRGWG